MKPRQFSLVLRGLIIATVLSILQSQVLTGDMPADLFAGFAEAEITPDCQAHPVYLAGFGQNRVATAILDPLMVRAVVLRAGDQKIAICCADLVGLFLASTQQIRKELPDFTYVLITSTHNHHGPDTLGIWGPNPFQSGLDPHYLRHVEERIVRTIKEAEKTLTRVIAHIGVVSAPELLGDTRPPLVKHDELVALKLIAPGTQTPAGIIVQWNCHPEALSSRNTRVSSDFVGPAVRMLKAQHGCPVVYLSGTLGGMMTPSGVEVRDIAGRLLPGGSVERMQRYGELLATKAKTALSAANSVELTPFRVRSRSVALPVDNKLYLLARRLGVLKRPTEPWPGDAERVSVRSEVAWLRLGELDIAVIPGEIYPELVLGKVPNPADPNADFPDAPLETAIYSQLKGPYRMIIGLGNDELGYIIPKRQWDERPPFTFGLRKAPYGEINSLGPDTAPFLCEAFRELARDKHR